jgi:hypothetical protein
MEDGGGELRLLAVLAATAAAVGLTLVFVGNNLANNAEDDYFEGKLGIVEYRDAVDTAGTLWLWGVIAIGCGVILVALAIASKEPEELRRMRARIEKDFYRKCPSCGSWNTKLVTNCSTCGVMLPALSEFQRIGSAPMNFEEVP